MAGSEPAVLVSGLQVRCGTAFASSPHSGYRAPSGICVAIQKKSEKYTNVQNCSDKLRF